MSVRSVITRIKAWRAIPATPVAALTRLAAATRATRAALTATIAALTRLALATVATIAALTATLATLTVAALAPSIASAQTQPQPYGLNDFRGFLDVLPPGTNGLVNAAQLAAWESPLKQRPAHNNDQLAMYSNLTTAAPNIIASTIGQFYKDATFGVPSANVDSARTESPEPGVTIVRDSRFGVPHIYGEKRTELMYGIGYATAEDRLFFIDVLRHAGQGTLAQFAGGANVAMDESVWASEPYTHQDLLNQINFSLKHSPRGPQIYSDLTNFVAGINAYIDKLKNVLFTAQLMPAEYAALGVTPNGVQQFSLEDLISIATLVGGIFGNGGGDQLSNAMLYENLARRFGRERNAIAGLPEPASNAVAHTAGGRASTSRGKSSDRSGFATFMSFADPADPEAPTTVHGQSFPYQTLPRPSLGALKTVALPDAGSVHYVNHVVAGAAPNGAVDRRQAPANAGPGSPANAGPGSPANAGPGLLAFPRNMSNALLVSGSHSVSGHPLAVMGPQVAYFTPEILMEEDIHGPGIDAAGAAFPGVNLYVELGHGRDYAWSATSSGQNIVDTFAIRLCNPNGGKASTASNYYLLNGRCVAMETLTRNESWQTNLADSTPMGSITLQTQRTAYGIVIARAKIHGRPVAYCNLRSTYMHELDSALGFYLFNDHNAMRNPRDFFNAAYKIQYTFNWFYADDKHIAYFNSGLNPVRAPHTNPLFPTWASFAWRGYHGAALITPSSLTEQQTAQSAHPQVIDQQFLTSWNNKQAPGYNDASTGQEYASVFRSQLLDNNVHHYLAARHGKLTLADLINAMGNAGTQDLRGVEVLPYALAIIGHPHDPTLAHAASELRTWVATGSHRINRSHPGASGNYDQTDAVRIMDAWWPLLIRAEFQPVLGHSLLDQVQGAFSINDQPGHGTSGSHLGSSWDVGFYGIVQKDLRAALHRRVAGPLNRVYCGAGSLARCRAALQGSLRVAVAQSPQRVYPSDRACQAGDQMCSDSIQFRAIGAVAQPLIEWINRPTFQQADEIMGHGPR
jgi:acyl-homoserine lactone acylase PvdQ